MTVSINSVQQRSPYEGLGVLLQGISLATNIYGQNQNRQQEEKAQEIAQRRQDFLEQQALAKNSTDSSKYQDEKQFKSKELELKEKELNSKIADNKAKQAAALSKPQEAKPDQYKVAGFASRAEASNSLLNNLEKSTDMTSMGTAAQKSFLPEGFKSSEVKQIEQAQRNFVNAILRRESGAMISKEEFASAESQYFPSWGDDADVLEQKRQNREMVISNLVNEAGPAWQTASRAPSLGKGGLRRPDSGTALAAPAGAPSAIGPGTIFVKGGIRYQVNPDGKTATELGK